MTAAPERAGGRPSAPAEPDAIGPAASDGMPVTITCAGCAATVDPATALPLRCPAAIEGDDIDHVLARRVDPRRVSLVADDDPNPFVRYRQMTRAWHLARATGWSDARYVGLVRRLDDAIAAVDGHGFRRTPFGRADALSAALGFAAAGGAWVKDETGGVSGSHKARHLMGLMLEVLVAESLDPSLGERPLAIASCGNAALAAAVVARAAGRRLDVFVPPDAEPSVLERLARLRAHVDVIRRSPDATGDPTVARLHAAVAAGAIPFTCQGSDAGLAIEGGETLGYEMAEVLAGDGTALDWIVIQVGGGALASACVAGLEAGRAHGLIPAVPRVDTVQTAGAWPLPRAYQRVVLALAEAGIEAGPGTRLDLEAPPTASVLATVARHRSAFMWPWESTPHSIAHGILDDETYDWFAVVRAMLQTGGVPVVVDEPTLVDAAALAARTTGISADETGTAGLAGLLHLLRLGSVARDERVAVLFTGARRGHPTDAAGPPPAPAPDRSTR